MLMITNETVNHAIDYILQHINEELSVDDVAAHCHFSKYYFSRMFKEATGESVYAFIKRLKLGQSAFRLKVEPDRTVTDIGCEFGYSPSNYSWMFRQRYQTNPVNFRRNIEQATVRHAFMHMDASGKCTAEMHFMVSFFFSGINAITSFYFTSIGKVVESAVISLSRGLVVLLICIFVLPAYFGMTGVWLAAPVTEVITILISGVMVHCDEKLSVGAKR